MAKLKLSFKGDTISVHHCDGGIVTVGRDPDNTIRIDSLAIAPKHIIIDLDHPDGPELVRESDDRFPVRVNGKPADRHQLVDGDIIGLGKHTLTFFAETRASRTPVSPKTPEKEPEAVLQFLNGKNIGRVIPLKQAMVRLGHTGGGIAVIARRRNGYFLSCLEGGQDIKINGDSLGDRTVALNHGDEIEIDRARLLFCLQP